MAKNLLEIKNLPLIKNVELLKPGDNLKEKLNPVLFKEVLANDKLINVYKIIYKSNGHNVIGFIIEPKRGKNLPCIIWNRGGSLDFGSIKTGQLFLDLARYAKNGYLVIASQYSGSSGSEGQDQFGGEDIFDVLNLYKIIKKYSRADAKKVGMYGWSRGGMMTLLALSKVSWIKAAVIGGALTDQIRAAKWRKGWREHQKKMFGGSRAEQVKRSALYWVDKLPKKTPLLIMHGASDWRVNPLDSINLAEKLQEQKKPYRLIVFEGDDHSLTKNKEEADRLSLDWFNRFLKNNEKVDTEPHGF